MFIRKIVAGILAVIVCFVTTGCWDMRELQERHFVLAVAIDTVDPKSELPVTQKIEDETNTKWRLSLQILKLGEAGGGEGGQKGPNSKTFVLSNTGKSLFRTLRATLGQTSKSLFFEHINTIIISESVLQEGIGPVIDFFRRDPEMRWRIKVFITPGEAKKLLEYKPPSGEPGGIFFNNIVRNHARNLSIPGLRTDLGYLSQALDNNYDTLLQRIQMDGDSVKVSGAALFHEGKFAGYLSDEEIGGIKLIRGTVRSAIIEVPCKDHPNEHLSFEIYNHDTRVKSYVEGDDIFFVVDATYRGNLAEVTCSGKHDTSDPKYLRDAEIAFAAKIKDFILKGHSAEVRQGVDVSHLGGKLKAEHPKTWEKVKDKWDEMYPTLPLVVSTNVEIRNIGEHQ